MVLSEWSKAVRARDGKCMHCGTQNDLHAHHIKPKSTHPELSLVLSNGITLCYRCHKAEHEANRPTRMRHGVRPQRGTLEARVAELEEENEVLKEQLRRAQARIKLLEPVEVRARHLPIM